MHLIHRELHHPTAVSHCVEAHLAGTDEPFIVTVSGSSHLSIWRLLRDDTRSQAVLALEGEFELAGAVHTLSTIRLDTKEHDVLVLGFVDAKISFVEYERSEFSLHTLALRWFEEEIKQEGRIQSVSKPMLRVDPQNSCVAAVVGGLYVAIMPLRRRGAVGYESDDDELDQVTESAQFGGALGGESFLGHSFGLSLLELGMYNVRDIVFLEGYYDPTILILYENEQTWSGMLAARSHTCSVKALSLDLQTGGCTEIWSRSRLPHDTWRLQAVPLPIGGALAVSSNILAILDQSSVHAVAVNEFGRQDVRVPFAVEALQVEGREKGDDDLNFTLLGSKSVFISSRNVIFCLNDGTILSWSLFTDGRTVKSMQAVRIGSSYPSSSMCVVDDAHFFLGSLVGDSLLVHYEEPSDSAAVQPPAKKAKVDEEGEEDEKEPEHLKQDLTESKGIGKGKKYTLSIRDSLLNVGNVSDFTVCKHTQAGVTDGDGEGGESEAHLELVTCSGRDRSGCLSVMSRSVKHEVITPFELPGCTGVFTVYLRLRKDGDDEYHKYLLLSQKSQSQEDDRDRTLILETGEELLEVSGESESAIAGIYTKGLTLDAGNLFSGTRIVQVRRHGLRVVGGGSGAVEDFPFRRNVSVVSSHICKSNILVTFSDDSAVLYQGDMATKTLIRRPVTVIKQGTLRCGSVFVDDDAAGAGCNVLRKDADSNNKFFGVLSWSSGSLDIIDFNGNDRSGSDNMNVVFTCSDFWEGPSLLCDGRDDLSREAKGLGQAEGNVSDDEGDDFDIYFVKRAKKSHVERGAIDVKLIAPSQPSTTSTTTQWPRELFLVALMVSGDLLVYKAFPRMADGLGLEGDVDVDVDVDVSRLMIRFRRIDHDFVDRVLTLKQSQKVNVNVNADSDDKEKEKEKPLAFHGSQIHEFSNINGQSGFFCTGKRAVWGILYRGTMRVHPVSAPFSKSASSIPLFSLLHNVNCHRGFLAYDGESLSICRLPSNVRYGTQWPMRKVPIRRTPHKIEYHPQEHLLVAATSEKVPYSELQFGEPEEQLPEYPDPLPNALPVTGDKYDLQLFSPGTFESLDTYEFTDAGEQVLCLRAVNLHSKSAAGGKRVFMCVGTGLAITEDQGCRGRVYIFDIVETQQGEGKDVTHSLKLLHKSKWERGPVSDCCEVENNLLITIGSKMYLYSFAEGDSLVGMGFIDCQLYSVSVRAMKNYIMVSDVANGTSLLQWRSDNQALTLLGKTDGPLQTVASDVILNGKFMGIVVVDNEQNVRVVAFDPRHPEARGGQRLVQQADFHIGEEIVSVERLRKRVPYVDSTSPWLAAHMMTYVSREGSIGFISPINEIVYRRLATLLQRMVEQLPMHAGLNPLSYRSLKVSGQSTLRTCRNILDGDLLFGFNSLSASEKRDFARQIGTTPEQIVNNLAEIDHETMYF